MHAATASLGILVGGANGNALLTVTPSREPGSKLPRRCQLGDRATMKPWRVIGWMLIIAAPILGACATKAGYSELAYEQDRCAGTWRSMGDADRSAEMNRLATESRRASGNVGAWEDILGETFIALLAGSRPTEPMKQPSHPSDSRGCQ